MKRRSVLKILVGTILAPIGTIIAEKSKPRKGPPRWKKSTKPVETPTSNNVGDSIDWVLKYAKDARWDIVARAWRIMEEGARNKAMRRRYNMAKVEIYGVEALTDKEYNELAVQAWIDTLTNSNARNPHHRYVEFPGKNKDLDYATT